jgi:hypothetical protein
MDSIGPAVEVLRALPSAINVGLRWFIPENVGAGTNA